MKVCKFVEGSFVPSIDGASEKFSQVSRKFADQGIDLTIVHCYRGWSDLTKIADQTFTTYAISPRYYYHQHSIVDKVVQEIRPDIIEMNDAELVISTGLHLNQKFRVPLVFDNQFVPSVMLKDLNLDPLAIEEEKKKEKALGKAISGAVCFTNLDKDHFVDSTGVDPDRVAIIPLGSDYESIKIRDLKESDKTVLFLGNMYFEPNSEAVEYAAEQIVPDVISKNPEIRFKFVGDVPSSIKSKYESKNINFIGRINDINQVFEGIRVCIAPIKTGGGMRVKILTYMSTGIPIVTTSIGAEGISDPSVFKIANDPKQFAESINDLFMDLPGSVQLGRRARELVISSHSW